MKRQETNSQFSFLGSTKGKDNRKIATKHHPQDNDHLHEGPLPDFCGLRYARFQQAFRGSENDGEGVSGKSKQWSKSRSLGVIILVEIIAAITNKSLPMTGYPERFA